MRTHQPGKMTGTVDFLLNVIPNTMVNAFAKGEILQVLLIAVLFGFALHRFGGRGTLVFDMIEKSSHVLFTIVGYVMRVAPIGAFGAMAFAIGKYGVGSLFSLGKLMDTFYGTCFIFVFLVLGLVARLLTTDDQLQVKAATMTHPWCISTLSPNFAPPFAAGTRSSTGMLGFRTFP